MWSGMVLVQRPGKVQDVGPGTARVHIAGIPLLRRGQLGPAIGLWGRRLNSGAQSFGQPAALLNIFAGSCIEIRYFHVSHMLNDFGHTYIQKRPGCVCVCVFLRC